MSGLVYRPPDNGLLIGTHGNGMFFTYVPDPLPVNMSSFTASVNKKDVTLHWTTSQEINNSGFGIAIKMLNKNPNFVDAFIDHVQITAYYSVPQGIETSTQQNAAIYFSNSSNGIILSLGKQQTNCKLKIYELSGLLISEEDHDALSPGIHTFSFGTASVNSALFIVSFQSDSMRFQTKVPVSRMN